MKAIKTTFESSSALMTRFPRGFFSDKAPDEEALPTLVVVQVSVVPDYSTKGPDGRPYTEAANLQFSIRATTDTFCYAGLEELDSALQFADMTLQGEEDLLDARRVAGPVVVREDEQVWHGFSEYRFTVQRSVG